MEFITALIHKFKALRLSAHIPESRVHRGRRLGQLFLAESALSCLLVLFELFAGFTQVVGLCLALGAKVLVAVVAPYSELTHMNSSIPINT